MRAVLKGFSLDPEPSGLSDDPADFMLLARLIVGPPASPGEESVDAIVCTPEWLATACRQAGGIFDARHHVVVTYDEFDQRALLAWFSSRVQAVEGDSWPEVGERLGRLGLWEFEDYRP